MADGKVTIELTAEDGKLRTKVREIPEYVDDQLGRASGKGAGERVGREFVDGLKGQVSSGAVALGSILAEAVTSVVGGLGDLVAEGISTSDALTKYAGTMEFAGFDQASIDASRDALKEYADQTVYELDTVLNTAAQLASNGVPDFEALAEAAGNLNAVSGGTAETFRSVSMVMTQTASTGRLTWENWLQLIEAVPGAAGPLRDALADMGAYAGDFQQALSDGQVTAEEFNAAVMEVGSEPVAVEAAKSVETFEGAVGNARAAVVDGFREMWEAANEDGRATDAIAEVGDALGDLLRDAAPVFGGLVDLLADFVGWVEDVPGPVKAAATALLAVVAAAKKLKAPLAAAKTAATALVKSLGGASAASLVSPWTALAAVVAAVGVAAVTAYSDMRAEAEEAAQAQADLQTVTAGVEGALAGIDAGGLSGVSAEAGAASSALADASSSAEAFAEGMAQAASESREALSEAAQRVQDSADSLRGVEIGIEQVAEYASTMKELGGQGELTDEQFEQLETAVRAFNSATGSSITIVDEQTGKLSDNAEAIDGLLEAYSRQARATALMDLMTDASKVVEQEKVEVEKAAEDLEAAKAAYEEQQAVLEDLESRDTFFWSPIKDEIAAQNVVLEQCKINVDNATEALDNHQAALEGAQADVEYYNGQLSGLVDEAGNVVDANGDVIDTTDGVADSASAAASAISDELEPALKGCLGTMEDTAEAWEGFEDPTKNAAGAIDRAMSDLNMGYIDLAEATRIVNDALEEGEGISTELSDAYVYQAFMTGRASDEIISYAREQDAAADADERARQAAEEAAEARLQESEAMAELIGESPQIGVSIAATGQSPEQFIDMLARAGYAVEDFRSKWESLSGVSNPLQAIEQETGVYTWQMAQNLQTNIDTARQWQQGMTELYGRVTNDQELAFAQYVESMGSDNLEFLNYLLYDADVSFEQLAQMYADAQQAAADGAVGVSQAGAEASARVVGETLEASGEAVAEASGELGAQVPEAAGQGAAENSGAFADGVTAMAEQIVGPIEDLNAQMEERGRLAAENMGYGFAHADLSDDGATLAESLVGAVQSSLDGAEVDASSVTVTGLDGADAPKVSVGVEIDATGAEVTGLDGVSADPVEVGVTIDATGEEVVGLGSVSAPDVEVGVSISAEGATVDGLGSVESSTPPVSVGVAISAAGESVSGLDQVSAPPVSVGVTISASGSEVSGLGEVEASTPPVRVGVELDASGLSDGLASLGPTLRQSVIDGAAETPLTADEVWAALFPGEKAPEGVTLDVGPGLRRSALESASGSALTADELWGALFPGETAPDGVEIPVTFDVQVPTEPVEIPVTFSPEDGAQLGEGGYGEQGSIRNPGQTGVAYGNREAAERAGAGDAGAYVESYDEALANGGGAIYDEAGNMITVMSGRVQAQLPPALSAAIRSGEVSVSDAARYLARSGSQPIEGMPAEAATLATGFGPAVGAAMAQGGSEVSAAAQLMTEQGYAVLAAWPDEMEARGKVAGWSLASGFGSQAGELSGAAQGLFAACESALAGLPDTCRQVGSRAGAMVAGGISSQRGAVRSAASTLPAAAAAALSSMSGWAFSSGAEFGSIYASGIRSTIGAAVTAAASAASQIASYLHFSEPKKGALRGINDSGGEMIRNYAASMEGQLWALERASAMAAEAAWFSGGGREAAISAARDGSWRSVAAAGGDVSNETNYYLQIDGVTLDATGVRDEVRDFVGRLARLAPRRR